MESLINRFLNYLILEKKYSENTFLSYKTDLYKLNEFLKEQNITQLSSINKENILNYFKSLKNNNYSIRTISRIYSSISSFFNYCVYNNFKESSPMEFITYPKQEKPLPEFLDLEEVEKILNAIKTDDYLQLRDRVIYELMYSTGIRVSELTNLTTDNLYLDEYFIKVNGKGNKERLIPFGKEAGIWLNIYLKKNRHEINKKDSEFLFLSRRGDKLNRKTIWKNLKKYAAIAGIQKDVYPHILRHSFATHLICNGADIRFVQELLGHSSIMTTEIYTHIDFTTMVEFYNKFSFR